MSAHERLSTPSMLLMLLLLCEGQLLLFTDSRWRGATRARQQQCRRRRCVAWRPRSAAHSAVCIRIMMLTGCGCWQIVRWELRGS